MKYGSPDSTLPPAPQKSSPPSQEPDTELPFVSEVVAAEPTRGRPRWIGTLFWIGKLLLFGCLFIAFVFGMAGILGALVVSLETRARLVETKKGLEERLDKIAREQADVATQVANVNQEMPLIQGNKLALDDVKSQLGALATDVKNLPGKIPDRGIDQEALAKAIGELKGKDAVGNGGQKKGADSPQGATNPPRAPEASPAAVEQANAKLIEQFAATAKAVEQLATRLEAIEMAIRQKESTAQIATADLLNQLEGLKLDSKRMSRKERVALVVFNSSRHDAFPYAKVLQDIFQRDTYRTWYPNYELALYSATNGKLSGSARVDFGSAEPLTARNFQTAQLADSTDATDLFDPNSIDWGEGDAMRRLVIVASARSVPPSKVQPTHILWKGLIVNVILMDNSGQTREESSDNWKKWQEFCKGGRDLDKPSMLPWGDGEASLISYDAGSNADTVRGMAEFERVLRWYIRPLPVIPTE